MRKAVWLDVKHWHSQNTVDFYIEGGHTVGSGIQQEAWVAMGIGRRQKRAAGPAFITILLRDRSCEL